MRESIFISVVIPMFNESENLAVLYSRLSKVLSSLNQSYEIICVNDGSSDDTLEILENLQASDNRIKIIDLSRNYGKEIALSAGLDFAGGEVVVPMDADLQHPPEVIIDLLEKLREGYDVVYAVRDSEDKESFIKKLTASMFYKTIHKISPLDIPNNTGDFRIMSRQTVDAVKELRETQRFMKGLFTWVGFRQTGITYKRDARYAGETKWNYRKLWNLAVEGITSFSFLPLQWAMYLGIIVALISFVCGFYLIIKTIIYGNPVPGYPSIMVMILFMGGVQLITIGIIGQYVGRIYSESKRRPLYFVRETKGF